jgi:membrane-associated phospholipid phosphatase
MIRRVALILLLLGLTVRVYEVHGETPHRQASTVDSLAHPALYLSAGLILTGLYINGSENGTLKVNIQEALRPPTTNFHTNLDDFLQWVPGLEIGLANVAGIPAAHKPVRQAVLYSVSVIANALMIEGLKAMTGITRPNRGEHSFPSGHTSNAFVNATVLYLEYREQNRILAWSGYVFATATGILRIMNNAHWLSDVVAGAGIGIMVPFMVYTFDPLQNLLGFTCGKKASGSLAVFPVPKGIGCSFNILF